MKDSLLNLVPGYSGKTGCFGTIVVNVGDVENSGSSSAIPATSDRIPFFFLFDRSNAFIYRGTGLTRFLDVAH